jgi:hypothetical protein
MKETSFQLQEPMAGMERIVWNLVQFVFFVIGFLIFLALLFRPQIGLIAFWSVLIPIAPALLVLSTGLWRNICPMAFASLIPRKLGWSAKKRLSVNQSGKLNFAGIIALLLLVPIRHLILDTNGPALAILLAVLTLVAVVLGLRYDWKSAWCSSLCPVLPVEKLYGTKPLVSFNNAQCTACAQCTVPCLDSTKGTHPAMVNKTALHRLGSFILIGGFPGYIWGWFQVQDYYFSEGIHHLVEIFAYPFLGLLVSLLVFGLLNKLVSENGKPHLRNLFAASAVACYYWFRFPALFGFGIIPDDGVLVDLTHILPTWFPWVSGVMISAFFIWWIAIRPQPNRSWAVRPPFIADRKESVV